MTGSDRSRRGSHLPRRLTALLAASVLAFQIGCHTYLPLQETAPTIGREVAVELNDRGRLLVGSRLGESVLRVDGRLMEVTDSVVTLSVTRTVMLQGSSAVWTGESVTLPREGLRGFRIREFSRGRTAFLVGGLVLAAVSIVGGFGLIGALGGSPDDGGGCTTNCGQS
jgi:hypothetical protein